MLHTIVVPIETSDAAVQLLPFATDLALPSETSVLLVHAVADEALQSHAEAMLAGVVGLASPALTVQSVIRRGEPAAVILQVAVEAHASLVIMATKHWSGPDRWLNGSIADEVLRHSNAPVLIVPARPTRIWRKGGMRVLLPLDGSSLAEAVAPACIEVARTLSAEVILLRVAEVGELEQARTYLNDVGRRFADGKIPTVMRVETGHSAHLI
jgi:nucleotide-binding universal stress UspA family protein